LPVDIALSGERIYLADLGRDRILVRGLDGADLGAWPVHDGPQRLAAGPDGELFVLGRGRNGLRYNPAGELVAWWPLADREREATDIAVDSAGQVYISHLRRQRRLLSIKSSVAYGCIGRDRRRRHALRAADPRCLARSTRRPRPPGCLGDSVIARCGSKVPARARASAS
jgi:hypothetical protein